MHVRCHDACLCLGGALPASCLPLPSLMVPTCVLCLPFFYLCEVPDLLWAERTLQGGAYTFYSPPLCRAPGHVTPAMTLQALLLEDFGTGGLLCAGLPAMPELVLEDRVPAHYLWRQATWDSAWGGHLGCLPSQALTVPCGVVGGSASPWAVPAALLVHASFSAWLLPGH